MGVYDRNYFREGAGGWGSGPNSWPPVCKAIVFINIGVFIAQILITRPPTVDEMSRYWHLAHLVQHAGSDLVWDCTGVHVRFA